MIDPTPGYLRAKQLVLGAGYGEDILWAEALARVVPNPVYVWREAAWVVVNSGFRYQVAVKIWPGLLAAFHGFDLAKLDDGCRVAALQVLKHPGKIDAICTIGQEVRAHGIARILDEARTPTRLRRLPWIGPVTCWHLAKVLGVDAVKPDLHLLRAALAARCQNTAELCTAIQTATGDRLAVVDSVLWRYGEQQRARRWPSWEELWASPPLMSP